MSKKTFTVISNIQSNIQPNVKSNVNCKGLAVIKNKKSNKKLKINRKINNKNMGNVKKIVKNNVKSKIKSNIKNDMKNDVKNDVKNEEKNNMINNVKNNKNDDNIDSMDIIDDTHNINNINSIDTTDSTDRIKKADSLKPTIHYDSASKKKYLLKIRKKKLFTELTNVKLEYKKYGVCDSYIKFGTPSLDEVIKGMQQKTEYETKRLRNLLEGLKHHGALYDDRISYYQKYIKYGGNLKKTIEDGEIEWFYLNKTNYLDLLKIYKNEDKAQSKALNKYIRECGIDQYIEKIREKDMKICIY